MICLYLFGYREVLAVLDKYVVYIYMCVCDMTTYVTYYVCFVLFICSMI